MYTHRFTQNYAQFHLATFAGGNILFSKNNYIQILRHRIVTNLLSLRKERSAV